MFDEVTLKRILRQVIREEITTAFNERLEPFKEFCLYHFERIYDLQYVTDKKLDRLAADVEILKIDMTTVKSDIKEMKGDIKRVDRRIVKLENNNHEYA